MWYLPGWRLLCGSEGTAQGLKKGSRTLGTQGRTQKEWWQGMVSTPRGRAPADASWGVWCKGEPGESRCVCWWISVLVFSLCLTPWRSAVGASLLLYCGGLMTLPKTNTTPISSLLFYEEIRMIAWGKLYQNGFNQDHMYGIKGSWWLRGSHVSSRVY